MIPNKKRYSKTLYLCYIVYMRMYSKHHKNKLNYYKKISKLSNNEITTHTTNSNI